eukprot:scaffold1443_cov113-Cylindrotheca_fusiformis.AAC.4
MDSKLDLQTGLRNVLGYIQAWASLPPTLEMRLNSPSSNGAVVHSGWLSICLLYGRLPGLSCGLSSFVSISCRSFHTQKTVALIHRAKNSKDDFVSTLNLLVLSDCLCIGPMAEADLRPSDFHEEVDIESWMQGQEMPPGIGAHRNTRRRRSS